MAWRQRVSILLVIGAAAAGCYKPNIQEGGFLCSEGGACPEGFNCASDGRCRQHAPPSCPATKPHVEPLCSSQPGSECDPICQNGCECGRCNLVGSAAMCVAPVGAKKRGDICNFNNDDCAPGNVCIKDCGDTIGRCYRFCRGDDRTDSLCGGTFCDLTLNDVGGLPTSHTICEPPIETCDPVVDSSDCANAALGCYVGPTGDPVCDCRGAGTLGASCAVYNSCIPGLRCVAIGGSATCFKTCRLGGTDCTAPETCASLGENTFGFCRS